MDNCEVCHATVKELRRGRCWGCYSRWVESRPVAHGAHCVICAERRRDFLKSTEAVGTWLTMCFSCSGQFAKLEPAATSLYDAKERLARDRRHAERRAGVKDARVFQRNRRGLDRRRGRLDLDWEEIADDMIIEILNLDAFELQAGVDTEEELTVIRKQPFLQPSL